MGEGGGSTVSRDLRVSDPHKGVVEVVAFKYGRRRAR